MQLNDLFLVMFATAYRAYCTSSSGHISTSQPSIAKHQVHLVIIQYRINCYVSQRLPNSCVTF